MTSTPAPKDSGLNNTTVDVSADFEASPYQTLVESFNWEYVELADDPFSPPDDASCDTATGIRPNELGGEPTFEIETGFCPWGTVTQPTAVAIKKGDPINFRVWHFELTGDSPATVRIQIGDWDLLEIDIPQPADGQLIADTISSPQEFPAGTTVYFHVHNHGANEYSIVELSVGLAP